MSELINAIKTGVNTGLLNAKFCYPAIVEAVDVAKQTLQAKIAIKQIVDGVNTSFSACVDLPFVFPTSSEWSITLPVKVDDEVLLLFADRCIDGWFTNGGEQPQIVHRVHDISDGFALIGINSQPNIISNYDADNLEIRNAANSIYMRFTSTGIESTDLDITGDLYVDGNIDATGDITTPSDVMAGSISLKTHTHPGVQTGSGNTGPAQ